MKQLRHNGKSNSGQMTIIAVISLIAILMSVTMSQFFLGYSEYSQGVYDTNAQQAQELAEAGIDNAILEYNKDATFTGGTLTLPTGQAQVTLSANTSSTPVVITITSTATYKNITRSETAQFDLTPPPQVTDEAVFAQNNFYADQATLNGEVFTNNDFNIYASTIKGDLFAAGKGNGQKNYLDSTTVNTPNGNINVWDPTYVQNGTTVKGGANYHTSLHVDGSSSIIGSQTKQSNSFIPPISTPTFTFSQAQTVATQQGSYFTDPFTFLSYIYSLPYTQTGGVDYYTLPSNKVYYVDCPSFFSFFCSIAFIFYSTDSYGRSMQIMGSNVSLVVNSGMLTYASLNFSSPYSSNGQYYPSIATNGDLDLYSTSLGYTLNGLLFAEGSVNTYGYSSSVPATITGGIWASNQVNIYSWTTVNYNSTYLQNLTGFNFPSAATSTNYWYEVP